MAEKITTILAVSDETKEKIRKLSAESLPINPSAKGMKPEEVKRAFYAPIIDGSTSTLTELQRIIDEANAVFGYILGTIGETEKLETDKKEIVDAINEIVGGLNSVTEFVGNGHDEKLWTWKKTVVEAIQGLYELLSVTKDDVFGKVGDLSQLRDGKTVQALLDDLCNALDHAEKEFLVLKMKDIAFGYQIDDTVPENAVSARIVRIEGHHTVLTNDNGYVLEILKRPVKYIAFQRKNGDIENVQIPNFNSREYFPDFGLSGRMYVSDDGKCYDCRNYIYFTEDKVSYHQGCKLMGYLYQPKENEVILETQGEGGSIVGLLNPIVSDVTSLFSNFKNATKITSGDTSIERIYAVTGENEKYDRPTLKIVYGLIDEKGHYYEIQPGKQFDDSEYVKKTDYASATKAGVVQITSAFYVGDGKLSLIRAQSNDIKNRYGQRAITAECLDEAVKAALSDCKITWTDEEKLSAKVLLGIIDSSFTEIESVKETVTLPSNAWRYAQITEIHGMDSKYFIGMSGIFNQVENYPVSLVTDQGKVLFEMPSDVLTRLTDFGYRGNYIYFDNGKAFYHQANRAYNPYADGGALDGYYNPPLEEGEEVIDRIEYTMLIIKLAAPVITDISDYITTDGIIDIGDAEYITVVPSVSEEEVKGASFNDTYTFRFPTVKILVETYGGNA